MKYCIVYNLVAYFGWGHNLEDYLGCLIACNNLKSHTKVSSLIYTKSRKVEALLTEDCTKTLLQRKEWGMCGNNIRLNSYGAFMWEESELRHLQQEAGPRLQIERAGACEHRVAFWQQSSCFCMSQKELINSNCRNINICACQNVIICST